MVNVIMQTFRHFKPDLRGQEFMKWPGGKATQRGLDTGLPHPRHGHNFSDRARSTLSAERVLMACTYSRVRVRLLCGCAHGTETKTRGPRAERGFVGQGVLPTPEGATAATSITGMPFACL